MKPPIKAPTLCEDRRLSSSSVSSTARLWWCTSSTAGTAYSAAPALSCRESEHSACAMGGSQAPHQACQLSASACTAVSCSLGLLQAVMRLCWDWDVNDCCPCPCPET